MINQTKNLQIVVIDDDPEMVTRPLFEELTALYGNLNVILKDNMKDGLAYVKANQIKKTIVILDYDFGSTKENGLTLFKDIQNESSLIYVILNTTKAIDDIPKIELKESINNHLMALVDKTDGYPETLRQVEKAISYLSNRVDCILEEWILRHELYKREKAYIKDTDGKEYSLNDILKEIRKDTEFGRKMASNIISTAISMLQNDINKIENQ